MNLSIDLNADLGEGCESDAELLQLVTSANIACGFHAGDAATMQATLAAAKRAVVAVGAHPGFADREHFGRRELPMEPDEAFDLVSRQIDIFTTFAHANGLRTQHVKPHGALYNMAARDPVLAEAVASAIATSDSSLLVFAPPSSALAQAAQALGLRVIHEFFADRNYLPDGALVPRSHPDALLHDSTAAAQRLIRLLREGVVRTVSGTDLKLQADTICVHGDTPQAVQFTRELRTALLASDIRLAAPSSAP